MFPVLFCLRLRQEAHRHPGVVATKLAVQQADRSSGRLLRATFALDPRTMSSCQCRRSRARAQSAHRVGPSRPCSARPGHTRDRQQAVRPETSRYRKPAYHTVNRFVFTYPQVLTVQPKPGLPISPVVKSTIPRTGRNSDSSLLVSNSRLLTYTNMPVGRVVVESEQHESVHSAQVDRTHVPLHVQPSVRPIASPGLSDWPTNQHLSVHLVPDSLAFYRTS
ncbi:unnamed protein product, partial [Protopolystoma xenopodis]